MCSQSSGQQLTPAWVEKDSHSLCIGWVFPPAIVSPSFSTISAIYSPFLPYAQSHFTIQVTRKGEKGSVIMWPLGHIKTIDQMPAEMMELPLLSAETQFEGRFILDSFKREFYRELSRSCSFGCHFLKLCLSSLQGGKGERGSPGIYGSKGEKGDRVSRPFLKLHGIPVHFQAAMCKGRIWGSKQIFHWFIFHIFLKEGCWLIRLGTFNHCKNGLRAGKEMKASQQFNSRWAEEYFGISLVWRKDGWPLSIVFLEKEVQTSLSVPILMNSLIFIYINKQTNNPPH